ITGAVLTLVAAILVLAAAVLLMRAAVSGSPQVAKYSAPGTAAAEPQMSERGMWDALDEGHDPTASDTEGR
ncbi:MAG: Trp biosynthesis-associated membrane protein, partial [Mycobacterium sp.]